MGHAWAASACGCMCVCGCAGGRAGSHPRSQLHHRPRGTQVGQLGDDLIDLCSTVQPGGGGGGGVRGSGARPRRRQQRQGSAAAARPPPPRLRTCDRSQARGTRSISATASCANPSRSAASAGGCGVVGVKGCRCRREPAAALAAGVKRMCLPPPPSLTALSLTHPRWLPPRRAATALTPAWGRWVGGGGGWVGECAETANRGETSSAGVGVNARHPCAALPSTPSPHPPRTLPPHACTAHYNPLVSPTTHDRTW